MLLKDIDKIVKESVRQNNVMLELLPKAIAEVKSIEEKILTILRECDTISIRVMSELIEPFDNLAWDKDVYSDLLHLIELGHLRIKGNVGKLRKLTKSRRRYKMLITYANRLQQNRGLNHSIYWYNRQTRAIQYKIKTDMFMSFGYAKDSRISKKLDKNK